MPAGALSAVSATAMSAGAAVPTRRHVPADRLPSAMRAEQLDRGSRPAGVLAAMLVLRGSRRPPDRGALCAAMSPTMPAAVHGSSPLSDDRLPAGPAHLATAMPDLQRRQSLLRVSRA
jgi:hypothetical protein